MTDQAEKPGPKRITYEFATLVPLPRKPYSDTPTGCAYHMHIVPNMKRDFAMEIIRHNSMVAARPDGEDSAGRQKLRIPDPVELAAFACNLTDAAFVEFEKRGWLERLPDLDTIEEMSRENAGRN